MEFNKEAFSVASVTNTPRFFKDGILWYNMVYEDMSSKFGLWNARSIVHKTSLLCAFVISNRLDLLAITGTWLNGTDMDNH